MSRGTIVSVDHILRLTVRFHVGAYRREADLALPAGSALADLIPEIVALCGAPRISRPWQATTAAGLPIDPALPLHQTSLDHGSVVVLSPRHETPAPVIRDAAESLAAAPSGSRPEGMAVAGTLAGCAGAAVLVAQWEPLSHALATAALIALVMLLWRRGSVALSLAAIGCATAAAAVFVGEASADPFDYSTLSWQALSAGTALVLTLLLTAVIGGPGPRIGSALIAVTGLVAIAALAAHLPSPDAPAALVVAAGMLGMAIIPGSAVRAAGLKIPRLPTAGQDLQVADAVQPDVNRRARRALRIHEGLAVGTALGVIPALLYLGYQGGGFILGLCVAVAGATIVHAGRHHQAATVWAWLSVGLTALVGVCLAMGDHPFQIVVALGVVSAAISAPMWAAKVPDLEPTTVVWWERAESLAIAASLPLAAHVAGLFLLIRGLG
ncbi:type VII secretion integral membrane protein EccD [Corynebacterium testudinoris]|nr:type VII secretion integral membrane protein EccD [Corynebacterium testudinoris]